MSGEALDLQQGVLMVWQSIKLVFLLLLPSLSNADTWILNNPYPASDALKNIYYSSFNEQPKTLDPARSYSSDEYLFIGQIYEPLLEYDYYKRPYELVPLTTVSLPQVRYLNKLGQILPVNSQELPAYSVYTIQIKQGIFYQPHPALAKNDQGEYRYLNLAQDYLEEEDINTLADFPETGTRELVADDYIYQIKRMANPAVSCPIYGLLSDYIVGFAEYSKSLPNQQPGSHQYIDLRRYPLKGVKKINDYTFEITLKGQYTQFLFWLAMPFFAPVPWEADLFYSQQDMDDKNLTFGWYPIGTGPFMLQENNPNRQMVLVKNPNYREVYFPEAPVGYQQDPSHLQQRLPLIDKAVYVLEKESIPRWTKFLQGYYDTSGVAADSFDQAIQINKHGKAELSAEMKAKKMHLIHSLEPSISYLGFNMLDNVVGGTSERARKLRQAISIAINFEEYIAIFYNGRGRAAQGPLPPGIFGYKKNKEGINPYVYEWQDNRIQRKSLSEARRLLAQADIQTEKTHIPVNR